MSTPIMSTPKALRIAFALSAFITVVAEESPGQVFVPGEFVRDEFDDGRYTDDNPIDWRFGITADGSSASIVDNDLQISMDGRSFFGPGVQNNFWYSYTDSTIQTQARIISPGADGAYVGLAGRSTSPSIYFLILDDAGSFLVGEQFDDQSSSIFAEVQTNLDPVNEDVILRYDFDGSEMRAWAWAASDPTPATPLYAFNDTRLTEGTVGLASGSEGGIGTVAYRWFEVGEVVPEPSTMLMLATGLIAGWTTCRRCGTR